MTAPVSSPAVDAQAAQAGLAVAVAPDIRAAFARLDTANLDRSLPGFKALIAAIVNRYGPASATLAARQYKAARAAAGFTAPFTVRPAPLPPLPQIGSAVDWAVSPLYGPPTQLQAVERRVEAATERLILNVGRDTIALNTRRDRRATGWARVTETNPCAFCAMLATRGAAYRSERSAEFVAHNHCRCHPEPLFGPYQPSEQVREWLDLYRSVAHGKPAQVRAAFRKAFEAKYPH